MNKFSHTRQNIPISNKFGLTSGERPFFWWEYLQFYGIKIQFLGPRKVQFWANPVSGKTGGVGGYCKKNFPVNINSDLMMEIVSQIFNNSVSQIFKRATGALSRDARAPQVFPILFPASSGGVVNNIKLNIINELRDRKTHQNF